MTNYLIEQLYIQAERYRHREFYRVKSKGSDQWESKSWSDFFEDTKRAGRALYKLGFVEGDKAVLCSPNCPELLMAEYGLFINRMVSVPVYTYSSSAQFSYIARESGASVIFAGGPGQYELAAKYCESNPGAVRLIVMLTEEREVNVPEGVRFMTWSEFRALGNDEGVKESVLKRVRGGSPNDVASLIYTSGATGVPKGVILTHRQFESQIKLHLKRLQQVSEGELSLSFLPMSHIFEKAWLFYCVTKGLRVAFNRDPRQIEQALREVQPNIMCCVPRFWEKIYTGVMNVRDNMNWIERAMVSRALKVGAKVNLKYRREGRPVPPMLMRQYRFWDRRLFVKVRRKVGIPYGTVFPTAGAALSDKICHFMRTIGIELVYGYGMTESTATVTCYPDVNYEIGTVGTPLPSVQIKIDNSGEILLKGPTITPGYYNNEEANRQAFTADGWFRTGDAGFLDRKGALILSSRKKDMFKTATGKYISPQASESLLASNRYIDEVTIIGEGKKYVSALVVPNFGYLEAWAKAEGIKYDSRQDLCENPKAKEFMLAEMQEAQVDLSDFEKVKNITLLTEPFSAEKGEITNTMKIRRATISNNYADHIAKMYPDEHLDEDIS